MFKMVCGIVTTIITTTTLAQYTITFRINSLPQYHAADSDIYIAGPFNGWNAQDSDYRFLKDTRGNYYLDLSFTDGNVEYKITRGSWDKAECKKNGDPIDNHLLKVEKDTTIKLDIEEWSDRYPAKPKENTASKNVYIIDTA